MKKNKLLIIVAYIVTLFTSLHALSCGQFGVFTQHNGHYYTTTKDRLTFEYAKTFAELGNGYLAIPNNSAENDFLASLVLGNQFAWIGIYDPSLSNNYCYETGSCSYDSSRFKTIKNQTLSFSNWGANQPDNLLKTSDVGQLTEITPLGEHWIALNSVSNKWYDFGNHNDEYNNPAKFLAIYEFDSKPECFHDDNTSELVDLHCNTAVSSTNGLTASSGQLLHCQTDANGTPFCPADLTACQNTQNTNNGYSQEHIGMTATSGSPSCPNGGALSNTAVCEKTCQTQSYSCPNGGTLSGSVCTLPFFTITKVGSVSSGIGWRVGDKWSVAGDAAPSSEQRGTVTAVDAAGNMIGYTVDNWGSYYTKGNTSGTYLRNGSGSYGFWSGANWGDANTRYPCPNSTAVCEKTCQTQSYSCPNGGTLSGSVCTYAATFGIKQVEHYGSLGGWFKGPHDGYGIYFYWTDFTNNSSSSAYGSWRTTSATTGIFEASNGVTSLSAGFDSSMQFSGSFTNNNGAGSGTLRGTYAVTGTNAANEPTGTMNGSWSIFLNENAYYCPSGGTLINGSVCTYAATLNTSNYNCNYTATLNTSNYNCNYTAMCPPAMENNNGICSGTNSYTYYTYNCNADTNVYHESYIPQNPGGEGYTSSVPPANNCVQQNYICNVNPSQTCSSVGGVWQCSNHPCVNANDMERTDTEVGSMDGNDNGWNQQTGACNGQLYLFGGTSKACKSWDLFSNFVTGTAVVGTAGLVAALDNSNCCDDNAVLFGLISCSAEEKLLAEKRKAGNCHYVGEFCSKKIRLGFAKICVQKKKSSCCFNSKLARIINEQGRPQLGKGWGSASNPECKGFTPEEFQKLDLSKIDFNEFIESFQLPNIQNIGDSIRNRVTGNLSVTFPQH